MGLSCIILFAVFYKEYEYLPTPSLGIGEAVPGITAGVLHLQTFSIPDPLQTSNPPQR